MALISIVINCDTRPENTIAETMFSGTVNNDFLTDGVFNKIKFFEGFDKEVILFVDKHQEIPQSTLDYMYAICDTVVIRKHTNEPSFNDWNYLKALSLCSGDYIAHFDQDTAAFNSTPETVNAFMRLLEQYDYISYPSHWSPRAVNDPSFNYNWASTRFFMCKRETIDFSELRKCFDYDYWRTTYPVSKVCPWMEHWLGSIASFKGKGVFYPPIELNHYTIFSWASYEKYTLRRLNELPYEEIAKWVNSRGGVQYPVDVNC